MRLQGVAPLFRPSGILIAGVQPPAGRYPDRSEALVQFYARLLERAREIPGVSGAAIADTPPLTGAGLAPFAVVGHPRAPIGNQPPPAAEMFYPVLQRPENFSNVLVKARGGDPLALLGSLRAALRQVDANIPLTNPTSYQALVAQNTAVRRMIMTLLAAFASVALALSMFGVYSVTAYAVGQRSGEIGVRMAMGALPEQVQRMVITQGLRLTALGVAIGIVAALLVTRLMQSLLFETPPASPLIYLSISAMLTAVAALACWLPARRAASVD